MSRNRKQFVEEEIKPIKYRNCLYKMKIAQYEVEVNCSKKKEGRQLAAQKILKLMHPHIQTWGSILRLYGSNLEESLLLKCDKDEKENGEHKQEENTQQKAKPNSELLEKLKEEMRKIKRKTLNTDEKKSQDTLLTIPPLLLGENEFNSTMKPTELEAPKNENDVIKFESGEKKRKLSKSDESNTTESNSSSSSSSSSSNSSSNSSDSESD